MSTPSDAVPELVVDTLELATPVESPTRPLYWSVRRELWENRSLQIAPPAVAGVVLLGFLFTTLTLPERLRSLPGMSAAQQQEAVSTPFSAAAGLVVVTAFFVGAFYCLDALYGERRDRSILFWKSLPVSDLTTILSKASVPLVVLPLYSFGVIVATQLLMLLAGTAVLLGDGPALATFWRLVNPVSSALALLYGLAAIALWHAPVYALLLLISAWAKRAPVLWALLPPLAVGVFEWLVFRTTRFATLVGDRLAGWFARAFDPRGLEAVGGDPLAALTPGLLLATPGLWAGLAFAAAALAGAARLRRRRQPI